MTEHIELKQLNSNLRYRFDYLSKFLNFTPDDIQLLNRFAVILLPRIPVVADTVYRKLLGFDITKQYFLIRNDGFEGNIIKKPTSLTTESAQMTFRKDMLSRYLKRVLTQTDWNDTFLQFLSQVGKMHTDQSGSESINVDYIHINALFGYLEHLLLDILWSHENLDDKTKNLMFMAINKYFWIQNDFFTMHYLKVWNEEDLTSNEPAVNKTKYCCL
ncbi:unnamed protein product [Adineta steineri]|uniref:Globin-sensor domain-containing protein n=1 Tax=Adineta steineri TaxID=433720 RepID=A0A815PX11_9BILA|nr:unnamed protein product [Adineta steineri]CAF1631473.1 unnamed protein product [Adineta steineri]